MAKPVATRLGFLILPGFPMDCLLSAIEPLRAANEISGRRVLEWALLAKTAAAVRSSADVRIEADTTHSHCTGMTHRFLLSPPAAGFSDPRRSAARLRWLDRTA